MSVLQTVVAAGRCRCAIVPQRIGVWRKFQVLGRQSDVRAQEMSRGMEPARNIVDRDTVPIRPPSFALIPSDDTSGRKLALLHTRILHDPSEA